MKRTIFSMILATIMVLPANALIDSPNEPARDIIVTMQDVAVTADRTNADQGVIIIQNPIINYKIQKGKGISEPLTLARFAELWSSKSQEKDSFAQISPNAQLSFWDPAQENFYEAKFSIEDVTILEEGKLQLAVRFLDRQHPIHVIGKNATLKTARAATKSQAHPAALSIGQIEKQLKNNKTSAVLLVDSSPWDRRKSRP